MQIREYVNILLELFSKCPYIKIQNIHFEERAPDVGIIKGEISFSDDSVLYLKQFLISRSEGIVILKYGYHYASKEKELIFRYDNSADPAARSFSTYPSHKHTVNGIEEAKMPDTQTVIDEISRRILLNISDSFPD